MRQAEAVPLLVSDGTTDALPVALPMPRARRYRLRGRHIRERGRQRPPVPLAVGQVDHPEDGLVLQVLRRRPLVDLDAAQVGAAAALPPSVTASALDRLVRVGLVRGGLVGDRERYGLP